MLTTLALISSAMAFVVQGDLSFEADFKPAAGHVPVGHSPLPYLRVCLYQKVGGIDFRHSDHPLDEPQSNDLWLGCADADEDGHYVLLADELPPGTEPALYMVTKLCDGDYTGWGDDSPAEVCVRLNAEEGPDDTRPQNTKAIWSGVHQPGLPLTSAVMDWNLSCPASTNPSASCALEPDSMTAGRECVCDATVPWKNCYDDPATAGPDQQVSDCAAVGDCGDTNSRTGCNKEAVHAYRAAIEPTLTHSLRPTDASTFNNPGAKLYDPADDVGSSRGDLGCAYTPTSNHCDSPPCQDEMQVRLYWARRDDQPLAADCQPGVSPTTGNLGNGSSSYNHVCIVTPLQPFRVVHEIGHSVERRWKCSNKGHSSSDPEHAAWREGWADFFAVQSWFYQSASTPMYCPTISSANWFDVESGSPANMQDNVTMMLWDLHDSQDSGSEVDGMDFTFTQIRNVLSAYPADETLLEDPGGAQESGATEKNALDYTYWWNEKREPAMDGLCALATSHNLDVASGLEDSLYDGTPYSDICY